MTGWGRGFCGSETRASYGRGGRGFGGQRGLAGWFGRGYGRGFGWGGALPRRAGAYGPPYAGSYSYPYEENPAREMDVLKSEAESLKARMEEISRRIQELEKPPAA